MAAAEKAAEMAAEKAAVKRPPAKFLMIGMSLSETVEVASRRSSVTDFLLNIGHPQQL